MHTLPDTKRQKTESVQEAYPGLKADYTSPAVTSMMKKGFVTDAADNRIKQTDRRFSKQPFVEAEMPQPYLIGKEDAEMTFVCFGSMKQVLLEAMKFDDRFNFIYFPSVHPINWEAVTKLMEGKKSYNI